ncbi:UNVERIFIED_CONTAM: hypothetical protein NCL1_53537 [Trichonephila clavipes]
MEERFQEDDEENVETWTACDAENCGFQMLNDGEIVTSVQENSDLVDDEDEENNNEMSGFIYYMDGIRFSVIRTIAYLNGVWSQLIRINEALLYFVHSKTSRNSKEGGTERTSKLDGKRLVLIAAYGQLPIYFRVGHQTCFGMARKGPRNNATFFQEKSHYRRERSKKRQDRRAVILNIAVHF